MSEDWGPWIEHDFSVKKCPFKAGEYVHVLQWFCLRMNPEEVFIGFAPDWLVNHKFWERMGDYALHRVRYRIRKPKGLQILEALLQDLPETVDA